MSSGRRRTALAAGLLALLVTGVLIRRQIPDSGFSRTRSNFAPESASWFGSGSKAAEGTAPAAASRTPAAGGTAPQRRPLRLHDESGRPLRAKIRVALSWDQFKTIQIVETESDDSGAADLALDPTAWVLIDVRAPGHRGQLRAPVTWGDLADEPVEFSLEAATPVELRPVSVNGPVPALRLRLSPEWPSGDFAGLAASKMAIVDEDLRTDATGRIAATSLRSGPYLLSFPDHPQWPTLRVSSEDLAKSPLTLKLPWRTDP